MEMNFKEVELAWQGSVTNAANMPSFNVSIEIKGVATMSLILEPKEQQDRVSGS